MRFTRAELVIALVVSLAGAARGGPAVPDDDAAPVTFNKHIAPILFQHCTACHRPGNVAPVPLLGYQDARSRATMLQDVTAEGLMPPWKSVEGHGSFVGERRLAAEEIDRIARWVEQGTPEGEPADLPALPEFPEGWELGEPDIVLTMPEAYEIPADGPDVYRNFVFKLDIPEGKYISAVEYRPSNRRVVHHATLSIETTGRARQQDEADPAPGYEGAGNPPGQLLPGSMGTWTPGRDPIPLPDGLSMPWKPGADFALQLHLHPSGKVESEQSTIGFHLTDQPPARSMMDLLLIDMKIDIPPGEPAYRTRAELTLPIDMEVLGTFPHMHLIGREFRLTAHPPGGGDPISLLRIDDWDFNWQTYYQYTSPMKLPKGTRIVMEATHDNSASNLRNPASPPRRVQWGEQTENEMSLAFLQVMPASEEEFDQLPTRRNRGLLSVIRASDYKAKP
jgi:mono/diheme cytochrome c family protein